MKNSIKSPENRLNLSKPSNKTEKIKKYPKAIYFKNEKLFGWLSEFKFHA